MEKKYLSRIDILDAVDYQTEEVDVPEWGGIVVVKSMSGTERDAFEASLIDQTGKSQKMKIENIRAKLVARTIINPETKELLFTPADIEALGRKSAAALDRVFGVSQRLSKITKDDIDDLEKNSKTDLSDSSTIA